MSMSKQFDSDLPDGDMPEIAFGYDDLESALEDALWDDEVGEGISFPIGVPFAITDADDEEEIGGVPSEYSGENDEPPARVVPVSQQIDGDDLESDLDWDIETDEDGLEVEYEDEDTVDEYGDDDISF